MGDFCNECGGTRWGRRCCEECFFDRPVLWRWWHRIDPMDEFGLRPLTSRDSLLWKRWAEAAALFVVWCALWYWLLSQLYDPGPFSIFVLLALGAALATWHLQDETAERDIPRWPRRGSGD